ncbi:MAG TPA: TonB-dependent receptor, partial [Steroidobacteraceae bacterium]
MRIAPRLRLIFISIIAVQRIAAAAEEEPRAALDEIIVTAQKREERLQDVPIAIVAVSGANLRNEGVRNLSDLNSSIPDVHVSQAFAQGYLSIRGLSSGINPGFESTVGQVIDGYFYPRDRFAYLSFLDIDRIEILKGPQGALIGKNTTAGAINITTAKPTKTFQGSVDVEREMEGDPGWTEEAAVSGPLVDTLKGRIAIRDEDHDGYLARLVSGGREPTRNDKYGRATLQWDPTDRLDVILSAARAEIDEHGRNLELIYCAPSFRGSLAAKGLSQYEDCQRNWRTGENYGRPALGPGQYDLERTTADIYTLTAALKTPWGTLSALSGYAAFDFLGQESGLRTAIDTRAVDLGEDWKQMSEEVRLVSNPGGRFDYILGGYFLNSRQGTLDQIDIFGVRGFSAPIVAHVSSNTYAGFGNLVWHATDTFDATLEGRYTQENKSA